MAVGSLIILSVSNDKALIQSEVPFFLKKKSLITPLKCFSFPSPLNAGDRGERGDVGEQGRLGKTGPPGLPGDQRPSIHLTHSKHGGERRPPGRWLIVSTALTLRRQKNKQSEAAERLTKTPPTPPNPAPPPRLALQLGHVCASRGLWLLATSADKKKGGEREDELDALILSQTHTLHFSDSFSVTCALKTQRHTAVSGQIKYCLLCYHAVIGSGGGKKKLPRHFTVQTDAKYLPRVAQKHAEFGPACFLRRPRPREQADQDGGSFVQRRR